jgi:hypothetical protein
MMSQSDAPTLIASVVASATHILAETWGTDVRLVPSETDKAVRYRSTVLRFRVERGPAMAPETVIVKSSRGEPVSDYDLADLGPRAGA